MSWNSLVDCASILVVYIYFRVVCTIERNINLSPVLFKWPSMAWMRLEKGKLLKSQCLSLADFSTYQYKEKLCNVTIWVEEFKIYYETRTLYSSNCGSQVQGDVAIVTCKDVISRNLELHLAVCISCEAGWGLRTPASSIVVGSGWAYRRRLFLNVEDWMSFAKRLIISVKRRSYIEWWPFLDQYSSRVPEYDNIRDEWSWNSSRLAHIRLEQRSGRSTAFEVLLESWLSSSISIFLGEAEASWTGTFFIAQQSTLWWLQHDIVSTWFAGHC